LTIYFSQGKVATDFRGGGSSNSSFLRRSFLNLTVKKFFYEKLVPFSEVIIKIKVAHFFPRHGA